MKILVVEDEPLIRLGLVMAVEDAGYVALEAINADQAILMLEADGDVRLVVTDVDMPGTMDGIKLAHYVRDRWPPIQLLVISGKVGAVAERLPSGVRFMSKPYQEPQLLAVIGTLLSPPGGMA